MDPGGAAPSPFAHLHVHSGFSFLDGCSRPEALVLRAAEQGQTALALTDTMSVSGVPTLVRRCAKAGIKPVAGCELLLEGGTALTLLANGPAGFAALCRILSAAGLRDVERAGMRARWEEIAAALAAEDAPGSLVCLSGAPERGAVPLLVRRGRCAEAEAYARRCMEVFGPGNYAIEVTRSLAEGERRLSDRLIALADHLGVPAVAANAVHYADKMEAVPHEALRRVRLGLGPHEEHGELPLNAERYLKSGAAMARLFPDRPDARENAVALAERLAPPLDAAVRHYPRFPHLPPGESAFSYLAALTWAGAEKRYRGEGRFTHDVQSRLIHELEVIRDLGYPDYFLVCWDVCREARSRGIGHALRGSAVGSAVAYCLGMSGHDPIARNVSFERFLSKARRKPPDIDIDFRHDLRDSIMDYTRQTYGADNVARVANYVTYRGRSLLRDLGKVLGLNGGEIDRLRELLHHCRGDDLAEQLARLPELRALGIGPERYADLCTLCAHLAGLPRHLGTHSSGIVVADVPLCAVAPVQWAAKGAPIVAFDKDDVEAPGIGLLKMDQLALRALTAIDLATNRLAAADPAFDYAGRDREDPEALALIRAAQTVGVFQLESPAQMALAWRMKAERFDDLVHAVALIRPGPLVGGGVSAYLWGRARSRAGLRLLEVVPALEPALAETYGRILFQDQVLDVVRVLGDLTLDQADAFLKGMTHCRDPQEMARLGRSLGIRALAKGMTKAQFRRLWKQIHGFSRYGFCEGHSLAFADHAQGTAWLLAHHPAEFFAAVLSVEPCGFWPIHTVVGEAARRGVAARAPCLNRSLALEWDVEAAVEAAVEAVEAAAQAIRCPLAFVRGIRGDLARAIVQERDRGGPFRDLADACRRLSFAPREALEQLVLAGAFDALEPNRRRALWSLPALHRPPARATRAAQRHALAAVAAGQRDLGVPPSPPPAAFVALADFPAAERIRQQWRALDFAPGFHPMRPYRARLDAAGVLPCAALQGCQEGERVTLAGLIVRPHRPPTPSGQIVVFLTLEDETGLAQVTVPPEDYARCGPALLGPVAGCVTGIVTACAGAAAGRTLRAVEATALP